MPIEPEWWKALCYLRQQHHTIKVIEELVAINGCTVKNQELFVQLLKDPLQNLFPKRICYLQRLCKLFSKKVEISGYGLSDQMAEELENLLLQEQTEENWAYKTYAYSTINEESIAAEARHVQRVKAFFKEGQSNDATGELSCPDFDRTEGLVSLKLSNNLFEGSTGCHEWEAGFVMFEYILSNPHLFQGKSCLELGSGSGLVGVALYRCGAAVVSLTDGNLETLGNCRRNLALNGVPAAVMDFSEVLQRRERASGGASGEGNEGGKGPASVTCSRFSWEEDVQGPAYDIILGSDILYDPAVIPLLVPLLRRLLRRRPANSALLATMLRNTTTLNRFLREGAAAGLQFREILPHPESEWTRHPGADHPVKVCGTGRTGAPEAGESIPNDACGDADARAPPCVRVLNMPLLSSRDVIVLHEIRIADGS